MRRFCLVENGEFVRQLPARGNVDWDATTTLPPEDMTTQQRAQHGCYFFTPAAPLPQRHTAGVTSYDVGVDTVVETTTAVPFTPAELDAEKEARLNRALNEDEFFKAFAKVAATKWGMTGAQFKAAIKDEM